MHCGIRFTTLSGFVLLSLSACQPAFTPEPPPEPQSIGVTPLYLGWVSDSLSSYRASHQEVNFQLDTYPLTSGQHAVEAGEIDLYIGVIDPGPSLFATPLIQDGIAVAHHPELDLRNLTLGELRQIFSGSVHNWQSFGGPDLEIQPVIPLPGDDLRLTFQQRVMGDFQFSTLARLQSAPGQTIDLIENEPGAVGLIPLSLLDGDVVVFRIEGQSPSSRTIANGDYPLTYWVTAVALQEPDGPARDWLAWVQASNN
ncbi:MAG: substrate-binding domain-containing protein [Anaerolineales bacterium]|nr:substrate-binding domain-containing protein [Anaerolineales bacterium]